MNNKAEKYRTMLRYLKDRKLDLGGHEEARIASVEYADFAAMGMADLIHYRTVLKTVASHPHSFMDEEAVTEELEQVETAIKEDEVDYDSEDWNL